MRSVRFARMRSQSYVSSRACRLLHVGLDDPLKWQQRPGKLVLQHRDYRVSARNENPLIVGGIAVIAGATAASYIIGAYKARQGVESAADAEGGESAEGEPPEGAKVDATSDAEGDDESEQSRSRTRMSRAKAREARAEARAKEREAAKKNSGDAKGGGFIDDFMNDLTTQMGYDKNTWAETKASFFAKNFYDGGFEDKMSKREAALILGVRENTSTERIKVQHRKILLINHPDRGGSPYVAAKINEAKDLLLKGKGK